MYDAGLLRRQVRTGQISVVDSQEEWYNAYEKDIAVANFYYSKPTSIGKKITFFEFFEFLSGAQGVSLSVCPAQVCLKH